MSFEKLKSDHNQTWVIDVIGVPSYVNEIKVYIHTYTYIHRAFIKITALTKQKRTYYTKKHIITTEIYLQNNIY